MPSVPVERALNESSDRLGQELLELPEDQWFERKSARISPKDLADALIGLCNAEGGHLVVGLSEGKVEGTDTDVRRRNAQMQASMDFTEPPIRARADLKECRRDDGDADHLLVFHVEPDDSVHANRKDQVFLRVGDENRRLTFAQRQELTFDKGQSNFEARSVPAKVEALDQDLLDQYVGALGASDPMGVLHARGLARGNSLTVAGCLLFATNPQSLFPEAFVRVLRYRGTARGSGARQQLTSDVRVEGPLPRQLLAARDEIHKVVPSRRALGQGGRFERFSLVPEDAWLEGLVNAVVHRSYSLTGDHIRVEIFDDRIEISSPGRFPGLVDLSDPLHAARFARNPRIARVCADLQFGQELGEGVRRMFDEMRMAGLEDPIYHQTAGSVRLTLSAEPVDRALEATLPAETRTIRAALRDGDRLSTGEIAKALGLSRPATIQRLRTLRDAGLVEWIGKSPKDPRAFWTLPSD